MILARTKVIGFPRVFAFFMLGPLIGITYAFYAVVFWLINRGVPVHMTSGWYCNKLLAYALDLPDPWPPHPGALFDVLT